MTVIKWKFKIIYEIKFKIKTQLLLQFPISHICMNCKHYQMYTKISPLNYGAPVHMCNSLVRARMSFSTKYSQFSLLVVKCATCIIYLEKTSDCMIYWKDKFIRSKKTELPYNKSKEFHEIFPSWRAEHSVLFVLLRVARCPVNESSHDPDYKCTLLLPVADELFR